MDMCRPKWSVRHFRIVFGRFVDLPEQPMLPGHTAIRTLKIVATFLCSNGGAFREEDV